MNEPTEFDNVQCECAHTFGEHIKPLTEISWDVCSFPCFKCDCQEFREVE